MVGLLIAFPGIVTGALDAKVEYNMESIGDQMRDALSQPEEGTEAYGQEPPGASDEPTAPDAPDQSPTTELAPEPAPAPDAPADDPMKAMQDALKKPAN